MYFSLHGVSVVYDIDYSLKHFSGHGTIEIEFPHLTFEVEITRFHNTGQKVGTVKFLRAASQNDFKTRIHPNNGFAQLWAKSVSLNWEGLKS